MYVDTQVRPQGEQVDAVAPAKLKLSAAIRIGAKIRPQCKGRYFINGGSCALGAAYEALGGRSFEGDSHWQVKQVQAEFLLKKTFAGADLGAIWLANDEAGTSRESIADWLQSIGL